MKCILFKLYEIFCINFDFNLNILFPFPIIFDLLSGNIFPNKLHFDILPL